MHDLCELLAELSATPDSHTNPPRSHAMPHLRFCTCSRCPGYSLSNGCKIRLVSDGPELISSSPARERNWMPLAIAAAAVVIIVVAIVLITEHGSNTATVAPVNAPTDSYASSLAITNLQMSESSNLAGSKVTYLDGHIVNKGSRNVAGVSVQVLFRNAAQEVAQNETQALKVIRTRDPYVDLEPLTAVPLKPGDERDFRLIFDRVTPDWDGAYPQLRILRVQFQ